MAPFPDNDFSLSAEPPIRRLLREMRRQWRRSVGSLLTRTGRTAGTAQSTAAVPVEKRRHRRIPLKNTLVRVTDGCLCATAEIGDISPCGICLRNLPEQLYHGAGRLTVFSSDDPGLPVLHIAPRWQRTGWRGKTIGAAIVDVPEAWHLFFVRAAGGIGA